MASEPILPPDLVARIRAAFPRVAFREQRMFGGTCFLVDGNMVAGTLRGELLVRVGKEADAEALTRPGARPMVHGGKAMAGYVIVADAGTRHARDLKKWVSVALGYVATLPAKSPRKPSKSRAGARAERKRKP